jgi:hypothetical protein
LYLAGKTIKHIFMVLIYMPAISNRAKYIFKIFFDDLIRLEFSLTTSIDEFNAFTGPKINYSDNILGDEIFIKPDRLLFELDIMVQKTTLSEFENVPVFFGNSDPQASLPFDPFAAGFYMVSRYEEFLPFKGDQYGRFRSPDSIAFLGKFIRIPVVNLWANMIRDLLTRRYREVRPKERKFRFVPTIDIDHAYAYGHRKLMRIIGGFTRDISNVNFKSLMLRTKVLLGKEKDPYNNYDLISKINEKYGVKPLYFVLFADYGNNDNNVSLNNKEFRALIKRLDQDTEVGIHPSLRSNRKFSILEKELYLLSDLIDRDVIRSRQHFLKISFPRTYRNLLKLGITNDYSMGYATDPGFRAGIADPFSFFDLIDNTETELTIHPVTIMDVTLRDYYGFNRQKSQEYISKMIDTVRSVNGEFVSLWHNESFSDIGRWKGWQSIYEEMLKNVTG